MIRGLLCLALLLSTVPGNAYTRQDTLRGSNGTGRDWWDVWKYNLSIQVDTAAQTISGTVTLTFRVISTPNDSMQIDLQQDLSLLSKPSSPQLQSTAYDTVRDGNVYWIIHNSRDYKVGQSYDLILTYEGKPRAAVNPPWDGGFIWTKDSAGKPWISVACQGLGASSWWPCKEYQGDEPDSGMVINIHPFEFAQGANGFSGIGGVANGKYFDSDWSKELGPVTGNKKLAYVNDVNYWKIRNPINAYNTTFYIGDYAHYQDTIHGEKGTLTLDFYPLRYNEAKARKQWPQAKEMLRCFEYWLGPYPFYGDGYKLVEAPYLGMEHQSAIAYGNGYKNGYNARGIHVDRSGTGVGFGFDYIIIHESGHEWFGNSITAADIADNWLHEGFTTYTETLFAEWIMGKEKAFAYSMGEWKGISNDRPIIGDYGVNDEGSGDKYDKGAAIVHMIRMMIDDDQRFRQLLRGLNKDFYHKIVTTKEVEDYISRFVGHDLKPFFDQYLRTTQKPMLSWSTNKGALQYEWKNAIPGFYAPFIAKVNKGTAIVSGKVPATTLSSERGSKAKWRINPCGWYDIEER
jgi:aminopeptidase N